MDQDASVVVEVFSCIVELDHGAMGLYPPLGLASYVAYSSPFNGLSGFFVFQSYFLYASVLLFFACFWMSSLLLLFLFRMFSF